MNNQSTVDMGLHPQTTTQQKLIAIWQEFFNVPHIDADSDFFDLGGNSLTAIKLLSRVDTIFGKDTLQPDILFADGRLGQIAKAIDSECKKNVTQEKYDYGICS